MGKNFCKVEGKWCKLCQSHGHICKYNGDNDIATIRRCPKRVSQQTVRLKDYVQDVTIDDVMEGMEKWFPDQIASKDKYSEVLELLKNIKAEVTNWKIRVEKVYECGYEYLDADGYVPNSKLGYYSITFQPWKHWAGMNIEQTTLDTLSKNEIIAAIFYEMTWWGFSEKQIKEEVEKLKKFNRYLS